MISPKIELRRIDNYLLNQYKRTPKARKIKKKCVLLKEKIINPKKKVIMALSMMICHLIILIKFFEFD